METTLYTITIPPIKASLQSLSHLLDKTAAHAAAKATERHSAAFFEDALLQSRLIFDQFPLLRQVQIACDNAKGVAARLAEIDNPKFEDTEKTIPELQARIARTIAFLDTVQPEQIAGKEDIRISLPYWHEKSLSGYEYATRYLIPNFYFHVATAYSILRSNGLTIGKSDYIGELPLE